MIELGLLEYWMDIYTAKANLRLKRCIETIKQIKVEPEKPTHRAPLSLWSLSGAFFILLIGYIMATIAICFELTAIKLRLIRGQRSNKINAKPEKVEVSKPQAQFETIEVISIDDDEKEKIGNQQPQGIGAQKIVLNKVGVQLINFFIS